MNLKDTHIVLGVTGGIAAYKAADLASRLVKAGARVDVIMTDAATRFVGPLTFQSLTQRPVLGDMFSLLRETDIAHVSLGHAADLMIVAPATANTLAKMAHGVADNLLTSTALAMRAPILVAPAMEAGMWGHPATRGNMEALQSRGVQVVGPEVGRLASGGYGPGRMAEPATVVEEARRIMARKGDLLGKHILISAGGTREPVDPVRYLGNRSSGKMGYALAIAARDRGAEVTLVAAPTSLEPPRGVELVSIETAGEMCEAIVQRLEGLDALIMAAAVADYRPARASSHKVKKSEGDWTLELVRTPDILMEVAARREKGGCPRLVVGFAAETEHLLENALEKLRKKRLDLIVANDVTAPDSGFGVDTNRAVLLDEREKIELPTMTKSDLSDVILDRIREHLRDAGVCGGRGTNADGQ